MSTSMSLDTTTDVKVTKVTEQETKDETMSLDAPTVTTTDFSEYSDEVALIPKEFLTSVDGRESYEEKYQFGAPELKDFTLKTKSAFISQLVKEAFDKEKTTKTIPIPSGSKDHLLQIIRYLNHQDGMAGVIPPQPLTSKKMSDIVRDPWVAKWADDFDSMFHKENKEVDLVRCREFLYATITLANYMNIQCAIHILCAKVASMIKGEPAEKLKGILKGTLEVEEKKVAEKPVEAKEEKKD